MLTTRPLKVPEASMLTTRPLKPIPRPLLTGPLCPIKIYGSPVTLTKFQVAPRLTFLIFSGSRKKQPRYTYISEAKASY
jgi:hypothetical protein